MTSETSRILGVSLMGAVALIGATGLLGGGSMPYVQILAMGLLVGLGTGLILGAEKMDRQTELVEAAPC